MSNPANTEQYHYQWQDDDNANFSTATLLGTEDTATPGLEIAFADLGTGFTLRVKLANDGDMNDTGIALQLQYNKGGAGWNNVDATSSNVRGFDGLASTNSNNTVERLSTVAGTTFDISHYIESGLRASASISGGDSMEQCYCVEFRAADNIGGEDYEFRLLKDGGTFVHAVQMYATVQGNVKQTAFRFVNDNGNESGSTFAAALNTDFTGDRDTIYRCRIQLSNTGLAEPADTFKPQKSINSGGWTDLLDTDSDCKSILSDQYTDNTVTTERLAGSQTFTPGEMLEGTAPVTGSITLDTLEDTEIEFAFQCPGLLSTDTVDFRLIRVTGGVLNSFTQTPQFVVDSTAVATTLTTSFATPSSSPLLGTDKQKFRAWVRRDASNKGTGTPTIAMFLDESTTQRQALTELPSATITSDSGQLVEGSWDATNLVTADGSGVELRIVTTVAGTGIQARTVEFGAVEWCVEHEVAGGDSAVLTGNVVTSAVGTVDKTLSKAATGNQASSAVGTAGVSVIVALTGVLATGGVGNVGFSESGLAQLTSVIATAQVGSVTNDVTVALTGVEATGEVGTISPSISVTKELTGVEAPSAVGTMSFTKDGNVVITGVQATAAVGSVGFEEDGSVVLTGNEAVTAVGTLGLSIDGSAVLTGEEATAEVGTLDKELSKALTGEAAIGAVGTVDKVHTIPLTGVEATSDVGNVSPSVDAGATLSGVLATAEVGNIGETHDSTVALTGVEAAGEVGTVGTSVGGGADLTGVEATAEVGSVGVTESGQVALTGVEATSEVGNVGFAKSGSLPLTGVEATGGVGNVSITESGSVELSGVQATGEVGTLDKSIDVPLTGTEATGEVGNVAFTETGEVALTGVEATAEVGTVQASSGATVPITGVQADTDVGTLVEDHPSTVPLTGVEATSEVGTVGFSVGGSAALTGVQADTDVGTLGVSIDVTIALTGVEATAAVGNVGFTETGTVALTGVEAITAVGTMSAGAGGSVGITGVEATAAVDDLTPTPTFALSGVGVTGLVGSLGVGNRNIALLGEQILGLVGDVTPTPTFALSGVGATALVGSFTSSRSIPLTGLELDAQVGNLSVSVSGFVELSSVEAQVFVGSVGIGKPSLGFQFDPVDIELTPTTILIQLTDVEIVDMVVGPETAYVEIKG